jgi:hypothetical protein
VYVEFAKLAFEKTILNEIIEEEEEKEEESAASSEHKDEELKEGLLVG